VSEKTYLQYDFEAKIARQIFCDKNKDYGNSWKILRIPSLLDQIYIKADRIRNIEEGKIPKINEGVGAEYIGIINYCVITLIQLGNNTSDSTEVVLNEYDKHIELAKELMKQKNHDYGEAWRNMYISSFTDLILARILRMKQILENKGKTLVSEGLEANLYDMINYAFFALIKIRENIIN